MAVRSDSAVFQAFESDIFLVIEAGHPPGGQSTPQHGNTLHSFPYVSPPFPSPLAELSPTLHSIPEYTQTVLRKEQINCSLFQMLDDSFPS